MSPKSIQLADGDKKAWDWIREDLEVGASSHTLSRKLLARFSTLSGKMVAFVPEWVQLERLADYSQGSVRPPGSPTYYGPGESPSVLLVAFVERYLRSINDSIVVCEESRSARRTLENWTWSRPPRFSCYGDDVYYILEASDIDLEIFDAALADAMGHWGTVACSSCKVIPNRDLSDDSFLDKVVRNTRHILVPAFDHDGYIAWSPEITGG